MMLITDTFLVRRNKQNIELLIVAPNDPIKTVVLNYAQAKELKDTLEYLMDDISADGCGIQIHGGD